MYEVFTQPWAEAWCRTINQDEDYARVARRWEGPLLLVMDPDPNYGIEAPRYVWVDLWHGRCREARVGTPEDVDRAVFVLQAPASVWHRILQGEIGPIAALIRGMLHLKKGNLMALVPYVRAAERLVANAVAIGSHFPKNPNAPQP